MSLNGEFSTMFSGEMPSLPKSLPSSREATTEGNSSSTRNYMPLRDFLDRFSLPRVVRLEGSIGRPVLLYKQQQRSLRVTATLLMHRYRHDVKVGPEIVIPEGYPGWFSVMSGNTSTGAARVYRRIETLVRTGISVFLLATPLRAYILTHSKMENGNLRAHYTKTTIRPGEVLRMVAIFKDTRGCTAISFNIAGSSPDRDQYAQCLDSHGREVFAPLSANGEFYAVCQNDDFSSNSDTGSDTLLYKVQHLARRQLPLRVKLIAGPLPIPLPREYGGLMQLESSTRGPIVLGCLVPETPIYIPEMLELLVTGNNAPRVRRARLGYPSETRLLASPKMQRLLTSCSQAVGERATEPRVAPQKLQSEEENLHLKKIKSKAEAKPIFQSLREGLEHLKKSTTATSTNKTEIMHGNGNGNEIHQNSGSTTVGGSFFERISKLRQVSRYRNPAKKSASFTFAIRPDANMKLDQKYSSLEPSESSGHLSSSTKQAVQRSISTSALEVPTTTSVSTTSSSIFPNCTSDATCVIELQSDYSRVRDSLVLSSQGSSHSKTTSTPILNSRPDDIYAEICENHVPVILQRAPSLNNCSETHVMARIKILVKNDHQYNRGYQQDCDQFNHKKTDRKYVNSIFVKSSHNHQNDSMVNTENDIIYNTVF